MKLIEAVSYWARETWAHHRARWARQGPPRAKIFCIGRNKTGTTSLASFFKMNGYKVGNQERAEAFLDDWARRDFRAVIEYCRGAEFFQDAPFGLPDTYRVVADAFPDAKFVLTVRSSAEEWYNSYVTFHAQLTGSKSVPPTVADLEAFAYRGRHAGLLLKGQRLVYGYPEVPLYDKQSYMAIYDSHNADVTKYFSDRPDRLLTVNLVDGDAFERLCAFVGLDPARAHPIPHLNRRIAPL
jgi:hypothetical protein